MLLKALDVLDLCESLLSVTKGAPNYTSEYGFFYNVLALPAPGRTIMEFRFQGADQALNIRK